jgi:hypothetical protein
MKRIDSKKIKRRLRSQLIYFGWWVRRHLFGHKVGSEPDSNFRRQFTRVALALSGLLVIQSIISETFFEENQFTYQVLSFYFLFMAAAFFMSNVVNIVFSASQSFQINMQRLLGDIVVSSLFHIVVFACVFRTFRIIDGDGELVQTPNFADHFYFSVVTFSTLGYGDFVPSGNSRLFAAYEALIGNLHLGFLVGATFLAANQYSSSKK